ncbi:MAG: hypothetical protein JST22_20625 [Bacteroidetes bacterium]|nr:hypothetical protein [Bacteroidota bacterium]
MFNNLLEIVKDLGPVLVSISQGKVPLQNSILVGYLLAYAMAFLLARAWSREDSAQGMHVDEAVYAAWATAFVAHIVFSVACAFIWGSQNVESTPAANYSIFSLFITIDLILAYMAWKHRVAARQEWHTLIS